jgi:Cu+-exporting ATPase
MHREISHADEAFHEESRLGLYLLTGLLGLLIGADLWPLLARWIATWGPQLPTWSNEPYGYRIALLAAILGGARTLYGSLDSLFEGRIGADLALAIACVAAILVREPLVAAEIVFIGMLGECLENITFARTQRAIRHIVEICPRRCWRLRDGQEERILTSQLQVGDRVVVKPGGRVPADGVVLEGRSAVDVSALTGEALPVDKGAGDEVLAGSLNQFGALTLEARRVAEHTVVGRVIEMTARALKDKAPLERTADRLARYFLPAVLAVAALTFLGGIVLHAGNWFRPPDATRLTLWEAARLSVYPALSVLVVACPCALILATPAAIIAALGRLAGTGVLIKGGSALERLAGVTAFAFDKTGTLTEGRLELGDLVPLEGVSADELLRTAATAEQHSEHLLARLILQEATRRGLTPEPAAEFQAYPGVGVTVRNERQEVLIVGNRRLLEEQGISLSPELQATLERLDAAGQTVLIVARHGRVLGVLGARDRIRPEAAEVLQELRGLGIHDIALLTGDRSAVAASLAATLGVTEVHAELLPQQKADFVAAWQQRHRVAMVGDGINDAPALARADVGLAIGGHGTDVAAEAGDVVFMGDPLLPLPLLLRLSRETVRIIRQNIFIFAFGVNAVGIVLTAWLWPLLAPPQWYEQSPVAAVAYHQLGSLAVLLNAMRLLWFERTTTNPTFQRLGQSLRRLNDWLEHRFDLDEAVHWLSHQWKPVLAAGVVLGLSAWGLSGLSAIGPDEVGVVRRFGSPLPEDLAPGLHWCWPWPIDTVTRVQPGRIHTIEIGFRTIPGLTRVSAARAWSSQHGNDGVSRVAEEAVMITGDGNVIELQGTLRYTIDRPRSYLFACADPDAILRSAVESVLRETVAGLPFAELLTTDRGRFQTRALERLRQRCQEYGDGMGVRLQGLDLHDLHPPADVVAAYHDVTKAMEKRDELVNKAEEEKLRMERKQEAEGLKEVRQAEAAGEQKVLLARAQAAAFAARYRARSGLSLQDEWQLFRSAWQEVSKGRPAAAVGAEYQRRRQQALAWQEALTDFRLYWDALSAALTGRDKILIDADRVPGRRNLWLIPQDPGRFMIPGVMPGERPARLRPGEERGEP